MQRHDTMAENRGKSGQLGNVGNGRARLRNCAGCAATRDERPPKFVERSGELSNSGLVEYGQQSSRHEADRSEPIVIVPQ
jgi:hypothetical protein